MNRILINNPVIKWSGSKRHFWKVANHLIPESSTWQEPFLGSGTLIPYLSENTKYIGSDSNSDLINLWNMIKSSPQDLINQYKSHSTNLQASGPDYYWQVRSLFNEKRNPEDFLFLLRNCINGLVRYNSKNEFNVVFHYNRIGINPDKLEKIITEWSAWINSHDISFIHQDYNEVKSKDIFIFLDPPYVRSVGKMYQGGFDFTSFFNYAKSLETSCLITLDVDEIDGFNKLPINFFGRTGFKKIVKNETLSTENIFSNYIK